MCIAILRKKSKTISEETLQRCFRKHPDGAGFAYALNGKLNVVKGFFSFKSFWKAYNKVNGGKPEEVPMIIHFRTMSHGFKSEYNCHPWKIDDNHAMVHNGILRQFADPKDRRSDTGKFTDFILKPLFKVHDRLWRKKVITDLIELSIGVGNKMIILMELVSIGILALALWAMVKFIAFNQLPKDEK